MKKSKLLWLTSIACNGNSHSFLNYPQLEQFLQNFEFSYHPIIDSSLGLKEILDGEAQCDILLIEGAISPEFKKAEKLIVEVINHYGKMAKKVISVGSCATFGGIFRESGYEKSRGLHFDGKEEIDLFAHIKEKTISISGCPIHPEILVSVLYAIKNDIPIRVDKFLRPKEFFAYTVHNGCTKNEYFEYKIDNHQFGKKEGCMFYEHGCQAPFTRGSCNKILWNEVNSKTRAGLPCFGCTEPSFPKKNLYQTKTNMGIPQNLPIGVSKRAYLTLAGITKAFTIKRLEGELFDD